MNSFHQESEALLDEAPRRVFGEEGDSLIADLRRYETARHDKVRDLHIAYARSAARHITEGMPVVTAMNIMIEEIPLASFDRRELIPFINYFLQEAGLTVQFDTSLNAFEDGVVISSGDAETLLQQNDDVREDRSHAECLHFAESIATRIVGGIPYDMLMQFSKSDLVWYNMDNVLVAAYTNECLEALGSPIRVNQYLEIMTYTSFD